MPALMRFIFGRKADSQPLKVNKFQYLPIHLNYSNANCPCSRKIKVSGEKTKAKIKVNATFWVARPSATFRQHSGMTAWQRGIENGAGAVNPGLGRPGLSSMKDVSGAAARRAGAAERADLRYCEESLCTNQIDECRGSPVVYAAITAARCRTAPAPCRIRRAARLACQ